MQNIFIKLLLFFLVLIQFNINTVQARDLAVMIYIENEEAGNNIYQQNLKELGLIRKLEDNSQFNYEYHVTIGYIKNVQNEDINDLKKYLDENLRTKLESTVFEFGAASLLGCKHSYIVALPKNAQLFLEYNQTLISLVAKYKDGKYSLDKRTLPGSYIPHLSLNGKLYKNININDLYNVLLAINQKMHNTQIKLTKLEIR
ncbi:hypothetical protein NOVO_01555 [Rickettsiales bacterium Ac37b]|nr:hypothetical protein NOVO_01555 [Rickettsiales bacterium Ac37b]